MIRVDWLTRHLVRVSLGGATAYTDNGFTDRYVKLVFPRPGVDHSEPLDVAAIRAAEPRERWPITRTYTVRGYDAGRAELAIDFVHHGDSGIAGPWAAGAKPGDTLHYLAVAGGGYAPDPAVGQHVLVGDESALPAIGLALERLPAGAPARVFVQVDGPADELQLDSPGDVELTWLHRGEDLVAAIRALEFPADDVHAFVHGEAGFVQELRRHLLTERGVPRERLSISGYWRRGKDEDGWQAEKAEQRAREAAGR